METCITMTVDGGHTEKRDCVAICWIPRVVSVSVNRNDLLSCSIKKYANANASNCGAFNTTNSRADLCGSA